MRRSPQIEGSAPAASGNTPNSLGAKRSALARQTTIDRSERRLRAVIDAQLGVDALDVVARRLLCDEELGGDLTVRPALRYESQDLDLPGSEPRRPGRPL